MGEEKNRKRKGKNENEILSERKKGKNKERGENEKKIRKEKTWKAGSGHKASGIVQICPAISLPSYFSSFFISSLY